MIDQQAQPGRLGQLLARLRQGGPKRPRWWHFAPHVVLVVGLAALGFFSIPDLNANNMWRLDSYSFVIFVALPLIVFPLSLLHALWDWLRSGAWRGAIWLLRPALLVLAFFGMAEMQHLGKVWDFERRLPGYTEVIPLLLRSRPERLCPGERVFVALPEGYQHLDQHGKVVLVGTFDGMTIGFHHTRGPDIYIVGSPPSDLRKGFWYDEHWYLVTSGVP